MPQNQCDNESSITLICILYALYALTFHGMTCILEHINLSCNWKSDGPQSMKEGTLWFIFLEGIFFTPNIEF